MKLNVLYIHGFGSKFDKNSSKCKQLKKIGNVIGIDVDYTKRPHIISTEISRVAVQENIDLIVGTSMGGFFANVVGCNWGIPFVMINPSLRPEIALRKHIGEHTDYYGRDYNLSEEVVMDYHQFRIDRDGWGVVLLDMADELFNSEYTYDFFHQDYDIKTFEGGSHRFDHMKESIPFIKEFAKKNCEIFTI